MSKKTSRPVGHHLVQLKQYDESSLVESTISAAIRVGLYLARAGGRIARLPI